MEELQTLKIVNKITGGEKVIQAGSAVRVDQCRGAEGDDFLKDVRVVRVTPGLWRVYVDGEKGVDIQE